jgi:hypothetical protein
LDATVSALPSHDSGEQPPTSFIQFGHHAIDGPMVHNQISIAA